MARQGKARQGKARQGMAWLGKARQTYFNKRTMNGYIILDEIYLTDFNINLKIKDHGKNYEASDINGDPSSDVRQVFRLYEGTAFSGGQSLQVFRKSDEPDITIGESPELFIGAKHRISAPEGDGEGLEGDSKSSTDIC
jgi:hypothetical protein